MVNIEQKIQELIKRLRDYQGEDENDEKTNKSDCMRNFFAGRACGSRDAADALEDLLGMHRAELTRGGAR